MKTIEKILTAATSVMNSIVIREDLISETNLVCSIVEQFTDEYRSVKPVANLCVITYKLTYAKHEKLVKQLTKYNLYLEVEHGAKSYVTLRKGEDKN